MATFRFCVCMHTAGSQIQILYWAHLILLLYNHIVFRACLHNPFTPFLIKNPIRMCSIAFWCVLHPLVFFFFFWSGWKLALREAKNLPGLLIKHAAMQRSLRRRFLGCAKNTSSGTTAVSPRLSVLRSLPPRSVIFRSRRKYRRLLT